MDDTLKIVKSPEDSGVFASLLGDLLAKKLSGEGVIRADEETIRAGYGSKSSFLKKI